MKNWKFWLIRGLKWVFGTCFLTLCVGACYLMYVEHCESEKRETLASFHEQVTMDAGMADSGDSVEENAEEAERKRLAETFAQLSGINGDYLGWLTVDGSDVSLPVVLGTDNSYYLNHDFYGAKSSYGTLFADCLTTRGQDGNLLIYGHHMKNGSMFGSLTSFCDPEFFRQHKRILWETEDASKLYEVFGVLIVPGDDADPDYLPVRDYAGQVRAEDQEAFLEVLKSQALIWRSLPVAGEHDLLFLITCDYTKKDGRLLLCAVRVE